MKVVGLPRVPAHGTQGKGFNYSFIQFPPGDTSEVIETDVLIIGSGCGGGVSAKNLAEAGYKVLVVDKAYHFPPEQLPMTQMDGFIHLFENGGSESSDNSGIAVLSGSAWGGGGTINWSASLQTQAYVREEWAGKGLPFFTSAEFQNSLDRVCERMGVSTEFINHNKVNRTLLEGARKLGLNCKAVPQNTGGKQHYCGYCSFGCGAAEKQGPVVSWLPDAARAGAMFVEGLRADKLIFSNVNGKKTATGLEGTWKSRDSNGGVSGSDSYTRPVTIRAKKIIVSCGTLQSPLLLMRSGLTNPHIGRNLYLHPVSVLFAVFPEEIRPWEGSILTTVVDSLQDLDGHGHGVKLEAITMMPSLALPFIPWTSGAEWKAIAAKFNRMIGLISLARERDPGRVYPDKNDGKCRMIYKPSAFDQKHILEGILACAKIAYVEGASEIISAIPGIPTFIRENGPSEANSGDGINDPKFQAWLEKLGKHGFPDPDTVFASAHQMGTCRMSPTERGGVVDPNGKVWGVEGLYVADASVFPSASGVNPMITNMAISDHTSRGLAKVLKSEARREGARL
jgi:choline dehydrogenase-like flavoprotein